MKIVVTLATLESKLHEVNAIKSGTRIYQAGHVEVEEREAGQYWVAAEDKSGRRGGIVSFTRDGCDIDEHFCNCGVARDGALCKHIVAGVLAIQGGLPDSKITLGKTDTVVATVTETNTARAVGSGDLDVFATPMMIALMEQAACTVLSDCLEPGQTSVGTKISVEHIAASPLGMEITATATIAAVNGRSINFDITASDAIGEIGKGMHTRVIVDAERFMAKANAKKA